MSDQYDDGRYDSPKPDEDHGHYYPDGLLQPDPSSGYVELPGGWRVPNDQMPGWPFDRLLVPIRGGMKYPTLTEKGTTMPTKKLTTAQELVLAEETRDLLNQKITELRLKVKKEQIPPVPRESYGEAFSVHVKFQVPGKNYRFLILRTERGYFTTGRDNTGHFQSWRALIEWLHGGDIAWHSAMHALDVSNNSPVMTEWWRDD